MRGTMSEPWTASSAAPLAGVSGKKPLAALGMRVAGGLRAAAMLLTRLPLGSGPLAPEARSWAAAWIPLVGTGLGLTGGGLLAWLEPRLGGRLAAALTIGLMLLVTGALHEDGLADTADALGGARERTRLFAILKDSHLGTYGVLALVLSLLVRIEALHQLGIRAPGAYLLAAPLSRLPLVWLMAALPYVTPEGVARSRDLVRIGAGQVAVATGLMLSMMVALVGIGLLAPVTAALALASVAFTAALAGWRFHRRAGGITGDFLGATQQLSEIALLLILLAGG
jgi:adenosylcobinamide-GDP ribazoletransferase